MVYRLNRDLTGRTFRPNDKDRESKESNLRYVINTSLMLIR